MANNDERYELTSKFVATLQLFLDKKFSVRILADWSDSYKLKHGTRGSPNSFDDVSNDHLQFLKSLDISPFQFVAHLVNYLRRNYEKMTNTSKEKYLIREKDRYFYNSLNSNSKNEVNRSDLLAEVSFKDQIDTLCDLYIIALKKRLILGLAKEIELLIRLLSCDLSSLFKPLCNDIESYYMIKGVDMVYFSSTVLYKMDSILYMLSVDHIDNILNHSAVGVFYPSIIKEIEVLSKQKKVQCEPFKPKLHKVKPWPIFTDLDKTQEEIYDNLNRIFSDYNRDKIAPRIARNAIGYINNKIKKKEYLEWTSVVFVQCLIKSVSDKFYALDPRILQLSGTEKLRKLNQRMSNTQEISISVMKDHRVSQFKKEEEAFQLTIQGLYEWEIMYFIGEKFQEALEMYMFAEIDISFPARVHILKTLSKFLSYITTLPTSNKEEGGKYVSSILEQVFYDKSHLKLVDIIKISKENNVHHHTILWIAEYLLGLKRDESSMKTKYVNVVLNELNVLYSELVQNLLKKRSTNIAGDVLLVSTIEMVFDEFNYDILQSMNTSYPKVDSSNTYNHCLSIPKIYNNPMIMSYLMNERSFIDAHFQFYQSISHITKDLAKNDIYQPAKRKISPILVKSESDLTEDKPKATIISHSRVLDFISQRVAQINNHLVDEYISIHAPFKHLRCLNQDLECEEVAKKLLSTILPNSESKLKKALGFMIEKDSDKENAITYSLKTNSYYLRELVQKRVKEEYIQAKKLKSFVTEIISVLESGRDDDIDFELLFNIPNTIFRIENYIDFMHLILTTRFLLIYLPQKLSEDAFRSNPNIIDDKACVVIDMCNKVLEMLANQKENAVIALYALVNGGSKTLNPNNIGILSNVCEMGIF